jgi:hypothetical protein
MTRLHFSCNSGPGLREEQRTLFAGIWYFSRVSSQIHLCLLGPELMVLSRKAIRTPFSFNQGHRGDMELVLTGPGCW